MSVAECTVCAIRSMNVDAPAVAPKVTVVIDRNVVVPGAPAPSVRSSSMR